MALFNRIDRQPPVREDTGPRVDQFKSLGLQALLQLLHPDRRYRFADLGPAIGHNIEYLSQFASRIRVLDLYETLAEAGFFNHGEEPCDEGSVDRMLSVPSGEQFDVVLGWDVVNYFRHDELKILIACLKKYCIPGTLFFTMVSTLKEMPSLPNSYKIQDQGSLIYCAVSTEMRNCPRFVPRDLTILMSGFAVHSSFMLRNGIQEYVFVRQ